MLKASATTPAPSQLSQLSAPAPAPAPTSGVGGHCAGTRWDWTKCSRFLDPLAFDPCPTRAQHNIAQHSTTQYAGRQKKAQTQIKPPYLQSVASGVAFLVVALPKSRSRVERQGCSAASCCSTRLATLTGPDLGAQAGHCTMYELTLLPSLRAGRVRGGGRVDSISSRAPNRKGSPEAVHPSPTSHKLRYPYLPLLAESPYTPGIQKIHPTASPSANGPSQPLSGQLNLSPSFQRYISSMSCCGTKWAMRQPSGNILKSLQGDQGVDGGPKYTHSLIALAQLSRETDQTSGQNETLSSL